MYDFGFSEILVILTIALIVLGPEKLPKFAKLIGNTIKKFKQFKQRLQDELIETTQDVELNELKEIEQNLKETVKDLTQEVKENLSNLGKESDSIQNDSLLMHHDFSEYSDYQPIQSTLLTKYRNSQRKKYNQSKKYSKKSLRNLKKK